MGLIFAASAEVHLRCRPGRASLTHDNMILFLLGLPEPIRNFSEEKVLVCSGSPKKIIVAPK